MFLFAALFRLLIWLAFGTSTAVVSPSKVIASQVLEKDSVQPLLSANLLLVLRLHVLDGLGEAIMADPQEPHVVDTRVVRASALEGDAGSCGFPINRNDQQKPPPTEYLSGSLFQGADASSKLLFLDVIHVVSSLSCWVVLLHLTVFCQDVTPQMSRESTHQQWGHRVS
jgi:hypothetical protein